MAVWQKIIGTQTGTFILGLLGVRLKNDSGDLQVRNNGDTDFAGIEVKDIELNGTTYKVTVQTNAGQAADYTLTLPTTDGSPGQVLETDGSGNLSWVSAGDTSLAWKVYSKTVNFGDASEIAMFTLPTGAIVDVTSVIVDVPFDDAPSLSVGVDGGNASKYFGSGDALLTTGGRYDVFSAYPAGAAENLEIAYTAGSTTTGTARVLVTYAVPATS